jgi:uncharacterized protein YbjT (DUF2867 family)
VSEPTLILVAGATGYVGTRLIHELLRRGHRVRAMARRPAELRIRPWLDQAQIVPGDALDASSLPLALDGVESAYYLIHNMSGGRRYRDLELAAARNFGAAARAAGLRQIVYLGGLGEGSRHGHMESRHRAGEVLRASGVPVTEFRASVIIGTGSISFEIIRSVAHWFPLIPAPLQTNRLAQAIATPDLLEYLIAALDTPAAHGRIVEIGGRDLHLYPDMMLECARQMGLARVKLAIPIYPLAFSARLVDRISPVPLSIARPLMQELVGASVITDPSARLLFPAIEPLTYPEAVGQALARAEMPDDTPWMDSLITRKTLNRPHLRTLGEGLLIDYHETGVAHAPQKIRMILRGNSHGELVSGWTVRGGQPGAWLRLERQGSRTGRIYVEIQQKGELLRWAVLYEPKGLAGYVAGWLAPPRFDPT